MLAANMSVGFTLPSNPSSLTIVFTSSCVSAGWSSGWVEAQTSFHSPVAMLGNVAALVIEAAFVGSVWAS